MYLLLLGIPVAWTLVLTVHLVTHYRILLSLLRWTLWTYLFVFALLMSEVVREGLATNGDRAFVQDMGFWWFMWALLIISGALLPWALVPATLLPVVLFSHPPFRMLINFGLARLGWTSMVYSPVFWVATNLGSWLWAVASAGLGVLRGGRWAMEGFERFNAPGRPMPFGEYEWNHP